MPNGECVDVMKFKGILAKREDYDKLHKGEAVRNEVGKKG
jgi:hypothetical protein